ncbi:MAG: SwmB domain-containing protein, partial [Bacteroidales bacterium]
PVYTGSSVENAAPSVVVMNYNLTLANIVPAASAFTVTVNSTARTVSSVKVSGTQVLLTLASPVASGNTVTVAYTPPSSNPLQTATGAKAASLAVQSVVNRVAIVNAPPVVVVNNPADTYSGFVGEIDASGSHDANNDKLTYTWKVPANIPVSATSGPVIQFLGPIVDKPQKFEFTLTVSDGKSAESKVIPVEIFPYQPGLEVAEIDSVVASGFTSPYYAYNIIDGNIGTMWAVSGINNWVILKLKESFTIQHIKVAFQPGQRKESYFDIQGSEDRVNWETILAKSKSCAFSGDLQVFDFPPSKTAKEFNYVRLIGLGNSADSWNYISEFRIFGNSHRNSPEYEQQLVKIFPNPARELVNILIDEQTFIPDFIKIISLTGKVLFQKTIEPDMRQFQIPLALKQGIYIVQMGTGTLTMFTQKLVVRY